MEMLDLLHVVKHEALSALIQAIGLQNIGRVFWMLVLPADDAEAEEAALRKWNERQIAIKFVWAKETNM